MRAAFLSSVDIEGFTGLARETFEDQPIEWKLPPRFVGFVISVMTRRERSVCG